jgi:hypothetical protein
MVSDIRHYSKKMSRKANEGTTTRYIVVEEKSGAVYGHIHEVRPTKVKDGSTSLPIPCHIAGVVLKEGISVAEIAFRFSLKSGFHDVLLKSWARPQLITRHVQRFSAFPVLLLVAYGVGEIVHVACILHALVVSSSICLYWFRLFD